MITIHDCDCFFKTAYVLLTGRQNINALSANEQFVPGFIFEGCRTERMAELASRQNGEANTTTDGMTAQSLHALHLQNFVVC